MEREWWIDEQGTAYVADLALPVEDGWLPVTVGERAGPDGAVHVSVEVEMTTNELPLDQAGRVTISWMTEVMGGICWSGSAAPIVSHGT